jgi:UDP-N-acetyl-D-galactosamine dehydrogenase
MKLNLINGLIILGPVGVLAMQKVAEAAKVIENIQRDVNIALMNELSSIFEILEIETESVLKAASTKWNFINFKPGLVGGHCIGIDPYYLIYKASQFGFNSEFILSARKVNSEKTEKVVKKILNLTKMKNIEISTTKVIIFGTSFKENVPDKRNTRVFDLASKFHELGARVTVTDPYLKSTDQGVFSKFHVMEWYELANQGFNTRDIKYDIAIVAVNHDEFKILKNNIGKLLNSKNVIYDIAWAFEANFSDGRL